ncbi:MAG: thiamine diphosphokinase [Thermotogaceae bacterium]|nr:thiamine diphosphokinase [Thermotogaceae bacterium]
MTCLFLNGTYEDEEYYRKAMTECDRLIAVDGGADFLKNLGILPDVFVGDMDSVSEETVEWLKEKKVPMKVYPEEKDETDLELALLEAEDFPVRIFGWDGERVDMILALFYLMSRFKEVYAVSSKLEIGYVEKEKTLEAVPGETWSILPLGGDAKMVSLKGFKYEIFRKDMKIEKPYGVSNIAKSDKVRISVEKGGVIYFRWKRKPL